MLWSRISDRRRMDTAKPGAPFGMARLDGNYTCLNSKTDLRLTPHSDSMSTSSPNPDAKLRNWVAERDLRDTMDHERKEKIVTEKYRGAFVVMFLVAIFQIGVLLFVVHGPPIPGLMPQSAQAGPQTTIPRIADASHQLSFTDFERLETGMDYGAACLALGVAGQELSRCRFAGAPGVIEPIETVVYGWINADGTNVCATFQNDKLIAKSQSPLPQQTADE
jgi:hypothetical protein